MNIIIRIATAELRNLFYSPVAWFLTIAFLIQCALTYTQLVEGFVLWQEAAKGIDASFKGFHQSLTSVIYVGNSGLFSPVIRNLYLFLPLLTMGIISREITGGSMKLLMSSPINIRHIVFGKYIAILIFNLVFVLIIGVLIVSGWLSIEHLDWGFVLGALLGTYLLICAYSAIGIFMSSLTTYQIVSAVAIFLTIFALDRMGGLWQQYDFVRDLTYFLSMAGRTNKMMSGLITSKDLLYFLLIIAMFLAFTLFRLKGSMEAKPWFVKTSRYFLVVIVVLAVGYWTHRPANTLYWDITRDKVNTIHPNTQAVVQNFDKDEPLRVTLYANLLGGGYQKVQPIQRNTYLSQLWERYQRFKPNIEFDYVYYYDTLSTGNTWSQRFPNNSVHEVAELQSKANNTPYSILLKPDEIREIIDLDPENKRAVMQLEYKGKKTFVRTFDDPEFWPNEMNMSAAFKRLQEDKMPKVYYTSGNLERGVYKRGEREYSEKTSSISYRGSLINIGFDVDTINLDQSDIPSDISYLVVADPKTELSGIKKDKIQAYIQRGGNIHFLTEPGKQDLLNPFLEDLGITYGSGTLVQITEDEMPHMVTAMVTDEGLELAESNVYILKAKRNGYHVNVKPVIFPGAAPVLISDSASVQRSTPVFSTDTESNTFSRVGSLVVDSVPPEFEPELGDYRYEHFYPIVGATRTVNGKEQRIVVSGDADFFSNLRSAGGDYNIDLVSWLDNNRLPIFAPRDLPKDTLFKTTSKAMKVRYYAYVWIIPGLLIILGSIILIRRKRK